MERLAGFQKTRSRPITGPTALLQEGTSLFAIYVIQSLWMTDFYEWGPVLARPSHPRDWPEDRPQAFCALESGGEAVELRLWTGSGS